MKISIKSVLIFVGGTFTALLIFVAAMMFMNPPQCPIDYTQEQVNNSNCIVGANIGIGFMFMVAIGVWITSIVLAISTARSSHGKNNSLTELLK